MYSQLTSDFNVSALKITSNKFHNNDTLKEQSALQAEAIMEVLEVCIFRYGYGELSITHHSQHLYAALWETGSWLCTP
jgi:hypothetical protein